MQGQCITPMNNPPPYHTLLRFHNPTWWQDLKRHQHPENAELLRNTCSVCAARKADSFQSYSATATVAPGGIRPVTLTTVHRQSAALTAPARSLCSDTP